MHRRTFLLIALLVTVVGSAVPAFAGGWATVTLTSEIRQPTQNHPWTMTFLVQQHGQTPINVDAALLSATHRPSKTTITATAQQVGATGNYAVSVVFPLPGEWKWSITPTPFQGSSFQTLVVLAETSGSPEAGAGNVTPEASPSASVVEVEMIDGSAQSGEFSPNVVTISAGTTVRWTNRSSAPHSVSAPDLEFADSGYLAPGASFEQSFLTPGTYTYHCDPHPWMTGTITVTS